ncbi:hypothetical protein [Actinosynnema mirum]|uniref:DUF5709 domain-containing protein n=1 Tax=Actinosynnema mirum (strain ATCC 29888 / DSM 43827 / JCM 3225 / NBRC 14064 / NCIMB 13271 / NRRL B-12336 / IMRU 3971 / 101) TaxID=446462 RepID=C6WD43_ACTMD|nr:hypothetical protein [Actinosynnema mirum]ACU37662.1 hypothetical protein Amir_3781 [Actinosynnema mirum DSM 43827]AXX31090.1 hypothetical protein APASM_3725 [Actinosynnema pretiosum subsp. pretiosum]
MSRDEQAEELVGYAPQAGPDEVAEELDEDRLRLDPLEAGMDPPEHWTAADKYGTTPYEQAHPRPLDDRLAEEQPELDDRPRPEADPDAETDPDSPGDPDLLAVPLSEAERRGQAADEAGGSTAGAMRAPDEVVEPDEG